MDSLRVIEDSRAATKAAAELMAFLGPELRARYVSINIKHDGANNSYIDEALEHMARRWSATAPPQAVFGSGRVHWGPGPSSFVRVCSTWSGVVGIHLGDRRTFSCVPGTPPAWYCGEVLVGEQRVLAAARELPQPDADAGAAKAAAAVYERLPQTIAEEVAPHLLGTLTLWDALFAAANNDHAYLGSAPAREELEHVP